MMGSKSIIRFLWIAMVLNHHFIQSFMMKNVNTNPSPTLKMNFFGSSKTTKKQTKQNKFGMPSSISLKRALRKDDTFKNEFFSLLSCAVKCGTNPLSLLQPSPCIITAETDQEELIGFAQLSLVGVGYLFLKSDFQLQNAVCQSAFRSQGVEESCIQAVLSSVPQGNNVWAVVPEAEISIYQKAGSFEKILIQDAVKTLWPSALFFGSPIFLGATFASAFLIGAPLQPFLAQIFDKEDTRDLLVSIFSIPLPILLIAPALIFILSVGFSTAGKTILKAEGQRK